MSGGILYASDAVGNERIVVVHTFEKQSHEPIVYVASPVVGGPNDAQAQKFLEFLTGPAGRAILREFGFEGT